MYQKGLSMCDEPILRGRFVRIQKHMGTVATADGHNPAIVGKRGNVHFDRHYQLHCHNDLQIYDRKPTIHVRLKYESPKRNKNYIISTIYRKRKDKLYTYIDCSVVWI